MVSGYNAHVEKILVDGGPVPFTARIDALLSDDSRRCPQLQGQGSAASERGAGSLRGDVELVMDMILGLGSGQEEVPSEQLL